MTWARRSQEALDISQDAHQSSGLAHHENSFAFFDALLLQLLLALHLFLSGHGQWRIAMNYEGLKLVQASFFLRISSCRLRASSFRFLSASFLWLFQRRDECLHSPQEACSTALQLWPSLFLGLLPLELHLQPLRFNGFFNPFSMEHACGKPFLYCNTMTRFLSVILYSLLSSCFWLPSLGLFLVEARVLLMGG